MKSKKEIKILLAKHLPTAWLEELWEKYDCFVGGGLSGYAGVVVFYLAKKYSPVLGLYKSHHPKNKGRFVCIRETSEQIKGRPLMSIWYIYWPNRVETGESGVLDHVSEFDEDMGALFEKEGKTGVLAIADYNMSLSSWRKDVEGLNCKAFLYRVKNLYTDLWTLTYGRTLGHYSYYQNMSDKGPNRGFLIDFTLCSNILLPWARKMSLADIVPNRADHLM